MNIDEGDILIGVVTDAQPDGVWFDVDGLTCVLREWDCAFSLQHKYQMFEVGQRRRLQVFVMGDPVQIGLLPEELSESVRIQFAMGSEHRASIAHVARNHVWLKLGERVTGKASLSREQRRRGFVKPGSSIVCEVVSIDECNSVVVCKVTDWLPDS